MNATRSYDAHALRVFLVAFLLCAGVLAFAYYLQNYKFLDPCPWCVAQRIVFMLVGLVALLGLVHRPGAVGARRYSVLGALYALSGAAAAGYQVWLQNQPERAMSCMGSWLERLLDTLKLGKLWPNMLQYDGPCTLAPWNFLGLSIPEWSFVCFAVLTVAFVSLLIRRR